MRLRLSPSFATPYISTNDNLCHWILKQNKGRIKNISYNYWQSISNRSGPARRADYCQLSRLPNTTLLISNPYNKYILVFSWEFDPRQFIFLERNNILPLDAKVSHYYNNFIGEYRMSNTTSRYNYETFCHSFLACPVTILGLIYKIGDDFNYVPERLFVIYVFLACPVTILIHNMGD
jgi:hypothetical protein